MPDKAEAQNITPDVLSESVRMLRTCCMAAAASCFELASRKAFLSSCRRVSPCIGHLRWGRCRCLGTLRAHHNAAGHAHYGGTIRNVGDDESVGGDFCSVADFDLANKRCTGADVDVVAQHGYARPTHGRGADGDAMG